jgi:hypothetical protein
MKAGLRTLLLLGIGYAFVSISSVNACQRLGAFSFDELFAANIIVRVTAVKYVVNPDASKIMIKGAPDSTVAFKVEEILKGADVPESIELNGYLSSTDDFNDTSVPYKVVRPGGRAGYCIATNYKQGSQYLLFLKKTDNGYTPNISPLGPTNEQLKSETDPWLIWVKVRLNPCGKLYTQDSFPEAIEVKISPDEARAAIYKIFVDKYRSPIQYRAAKCYLQKYGSEDDQYVKYIRRWVEAYEKAEEKK